MNKPELLAGAGSFEKAKIAFLYGADAVYIGTPKLSLRSRSNIEDDDLPKIIEYAHKFGKKVYVALNIYAPDELYDEIKEQVLVLKKYKPDGIIISDGGVVDLVREVAPEIPINISTQANTLSYHTAKFWQRNGAKRIILSREMNKEDIKEVIKNIPKDLETEIFIHGAICWAYSGRCYLSEYLSSRNANLGDCAHSCRWQYNMYLEEQAHPGNFMKVETDENGTYILSSKDLCLINEIPEIVDMGITSLKIEGRLKSEYYIANVTHVYRMAIDDYVKNPKSFDSKKYMEELERLKTRELTTFFFNDKSNKDFQEYQGKQYNEDYEYGAQVLEYNKDLSIVKIGNKLTVGDEMEMILPNQLEAIKFTINKLYDIDTGEEIETINPGKLNQSVKMKLPHEAPQGTIIRRKR